MCFVNLASFETNPVFCTQPDSDFDLQRPYDLMGFIQQEKRVDLVESLRVDLIDQKNMIDATEDKETDLEARFYEQDPDCVKAGQPLTEFDLYLSTVFPLDNKGYRYSMRTCNNCTKNVQKNVFKHFC